jgi:hypothetical protein
MSLYVSPRPSIAASGLDPVNLPARGAIDVGKDIDVSAAKTILSDGAIWSGIFDIRCGCGAAGRTADSSDTGRVLRGVDADQVGLNSMRFDGLHDVVAASPKENRLSPSEFWALKRLTFCASD